MKRKLRPCVQYALQAIAVLSAIPLVMLNDFTTPGGLIQIAILMIMSTGSIYMLSKYGRY